MCFCLKNKNGDLQTQDDSKMDRENVERTEQQKPW